MYIDPQGSEGSVYVFIVYTFFSENRGKRLLKLFDGSIRCLSQNYAVQ